MSRLKEFEKELGDLIKKYDAEISFEIVDDEPIIRFTVDTYSKGQSEVFCEGQDFLDKEDF